MSEITEQDAREAAIDIVDGHYGESNEDLDQWHDDIRTCSRWIVQELSRRDAERAEREKPITAEWLESIGFYRDTTEGRYFEQQEIAGAFYLRNNGRLVWRCEVYELFEAETRGQLLDLLRALRGVA